MLLQFAVENFSSFRDKAVLSMMPVAGVAHDETQLVRLPDGTELLKCAAIYGANASGKSNLVKALDFARDLITEGTKRGAPLGTRPFKLDPAKLEAPSRFEFELHTGERRYSYGFLVSSRAVESEWLHVTEGGEEAQIFERSPRADDPTKVEVTRGAALRSDAARIQFLAEGTRPNQLFLTEAVDRQVPEVTPVRACFDALEIAFPSSLYVGLAARLDKDPDFRDHVTSFLRAIDTGVSRVTVRRSSAPKGARIDVEKDPETGKLERLDIELLHDGRDGAPVVFDFLEESDGTRRVMHLSPALYQSRQRDLLVVVDEIDRNLHPHLTRAFLQSFLEGAPQGRCSQLVFTTHDTNLLDVALLPEDSIWFVEKKPDGASELYSLAEYKGEQIEQLKSLEKGYLQGRFGAVPFFSDPAKLGWQRGRR